MYPPTVVVQTTNKQKMKETMAQARNYTDKKNPTLTQNKIRHVCIYKKVE